MPERSEYTPGTPCWVDLGSDVEGAKKFYGGFFGWGSQDAGPPEETGGYGFFTKDGKVVAGYGPQQNPGPPMWSIYVSVADANETAEKVEGAGGTVVMPPMQVMAAGTMAVFMDHQGAFIAAWQPGDHKGAELVNEPGSFSWNELQTRDPEGSKEFYRSVFGWESVTHGEGSGAYTEWLLNGAGVGGMMQMQAMVPAQVPPRWVVYFAVDDTDAAVGKVTELGGAVMVPPVDVQPGRLSAVSDAQGASFVVIKLTTPGP